jgi:hypothetical protein
MLDTFTYPKQTDEAKGKVATGRSLALSRFSTSSSRRPFSVCNTPSIDFVLDVGSSKNLDKMLRSLEEDDQ